MSLRVGLIGFGAIGRQVAVGIAAGRAGDMRLAAVLTRQSHPDAPGAQCATELESFLASGPEVVVEAASAAAVAALAEQIVLTGASMIVASASALADAALRARLDAACRTSGARVYLPAGALAGLDALSAAGVAEMDTPSLRVVEPGQDIRVVFRGSALEAARRFPQRLNIAATAALAVGTDLEVTLEQQATDVRTIELGAHGAFGTFFARVQPGAPTDQLSHIVALSLLAALRRLQQPIWIG
jgi:aspartate dehydrogenase